MQEWKSRKANRRPNIEECRMMAMIGQPGQKGCKTKEDDLTISRNKEKKKKTNLMEGSC